LRGKNWSKITTSYIDKESRGRNQESAGWGFKAIGDSKMICGFGLEFFKKGFHELMKTVAENKKGLYELMKTVAENKKGLHELLKG
jgi:hypothetical protein